MDSAVTRPVAPWVGGKALLADRIIKRISKIPHVCYAEPFIGMGGVFLRRPERSKSEVINDYSRDVSNFFRILQRHYVPFMEMMRFQITTRAEFERLTDTNPDTLTDLERAARFLYLQRTAFGGRPSGRNFGITRTAPARFDITKLAPMLEDLHGRLTRVVIECLPYQNFIQRYDSADTLFYLDPPYYGRENYYGQGLFSRDDFVTINRLLSELQGRFILSLNDVPEIRKIFSGFKISSVKTRYSINTVKGGKQKTAGEVLISN